jgi:ubiquinone/menaquinone biosynthesis C-methylase UbiE
MDIQEDYNRWSSAYNFDTNITRDLDYHKVRERFESGSFEIVLELGCGTGKNTPLFAAVAAKVISLDFSLGMLSVAKRSVLVENVTFVHADIRQAWPVPTASIDLIACSLVLQHVEDLLPVFREASRVLTPGGMMFLSELHPIKGYQGSMARYLWKDEPKAIPAFDHQISHFTEAAKAFGLRLTDLSEWWHADDAGRPPRIVALTFTR